MAVQGQPRKCRDAASTSRWYCKANRYKRSTVGKWVCQRRQCIPSYLKRAIAALGVARECGALAAGLSIRSLGGYAGDVAHRHRAAIAVFVHGVAG